MPAGTVLKVVNGDVNVTTSGQVIDGEDIKGALYINASNVTVRRTLVEGRAGADSVFVQSGSNILFEDDEINARSPSTGLDDMRLTNATAVRLNIHGGVDGIKLFSNSTVSDSWIHGLSWFPHDPAHANGPTHNDTIQILGGSNIHVLNNFLQSGTIDNSAIQVTQDSGKISALTINGNWADGGACTFNFSGHNSAGKKVALTGITMTNNRFGPNSKLNCAVNIDLKTVLTASSGNVWDTTGKPIEILRNN